MSTTPTAIKPSRTSGLAGWEGHLRPGGCGRSADLEGGIEVAGEAVFQRRQPLALPPEDLACLARGRDPQLALSRKTDWAEPLPGFYVGTGQRMFATDAGDLSLMDLREVTFGAA